MPLPPPDDLNAVSHVVDPGRDHDLGFANRRAGPEGMTEASLRTCQ